MNIALSIIFGFIVAVLGIALGLFWLPTVALYIIGRKWLTVRSRKLGEQEAKESSSLGLWFRCIWGWTWRSFLIFVLPFGILACALGGNDPERMARGLAFVLAGWILTLFFSLDAPIWSLGRSQRSPGSDIPKEVYDQIAEEFRTGTYDQGLWFKSLTATEGDQNKAFAAYTVERASELGIEQRPSPVPQSASRSFAILAVVAVGAFWIWGVLTGFGQTSLVDLSHRYFHGHWSSAVAIKPPSSTPALSAVTRPPSLAQTSSIPASDVETIPPAASIPASDVAPLTALDMYKIGLGDDTGGDHTQALLWYRRAAAAGNTDAMFRLGYDYETGKGTEKDYSQAMLWFRAAMVSGNSDAMIQIGGLYANGWGVPQDYAAATMWMSMAANAGNGIAMYNLGVAYENGIGISANNDQAVTWYRKAAAQGIKAAITALKRLSYTPPIPNSGSDSKFDPDAFLKTPVKINASPDPIAPSPATQTIAPEDVVPIPPKAND
jgi:hypothetical protein